MHLEQALAENTAALKALTAALASGSVLPHPAPSMQPAPTVAPYTAAADPALIARVVSPDTSPAPTTAFAQVVPMPQPPVETVVPPTAPPAASGSVERDANGMPWDGRIHASTKAKVADGTWRYKRGVDDTVIKPIEAELRAAAAAPAPVGSAFAPHPFLAPEATQPPVAAAVAPVPPPPAPAAPPPVVAPPPVAPVAVPVAGTTGITSYETLMAALPNKIVSGELTATQLQQACEMFGVPSIAALQGRPDLVQSVAAALRL